MEAVSGFGFHQRQPWWVPTASQERAFLDSLDLSAVIMAQRTFSEVEAMPAAKASAFLAYHADCPHGWCPLARRDLDLHVTRVQILARAWAALLDAHT